MRDSLDQAQGRPPATRPRRAAPRRLPKGGVRSALQPRRPIAWRRGSTKARRAFITAAAKAEAAASVSHSGSVHRRMPMARGRMCGRGTSWQRRRGITDAGAVIKYTQQELPACKPILTPKWVNSVFPTSNSKMLRASQQVVETVDRYDDTCVPVGVTDKLAVFFLASNRTSGEKSSFS